MRLDLPFGSFGSSSIIYSVVSASFVLVLIALLFFSNKLLLHMRIGSLLFLLALVVFRLFLPLDYAPFTKTINLKGIPVMLCDFIRAPVFPESFGIPLYVYELLLFVWAVGIVVFSMRFIFRWKKLKLFISRLSPCEDPRVLSVLHDLTEELCLPRVPEIRYLPFRGSPRIGGCFHPVILISQTEFSDRDLYYTLLHELTHYRKKDAFWKLCIELLVILYWWNPFIYFIRSEIDRLLEFRVDSTITGGASKEEKTDYMECIRNTITSSPYLKSSSFFFLSPPKVSASQRFHMIINSSSGKRRIPSILACLSAFFFMFGIIIEPSYSPDEGFTINMEDAYYILTSDSKYMLYSDDIYLVTLDSLPNDPDFHFPIYTSYRGNKNDF